MIIDSTFPYFSSIQKFSLQTFSLDTYHYLSTNKPYPQIIGFTTQISCRINYYPTLAVPRIGFMYEIYQGTSYSTRVTLRSTVSNYNAISARVLLLAFYISEFPTYKYKVETAYISPASTSAYYYSYYLDDKLSAGIFGLNSFYINPTYGSTTDSLRFKMTYSTANQRFEVSQAGAYTAIYYLFFMIN